MMRVFLLCIPTSVPPSQLTATLLWSTSCRHSPDEYMKGTICLQYCLINNKLSCSILICQTIMNIHVSFRRIYHIRKFIMLVTALEYIGVIRGIMGRSSWWCERNCVTERRRCWATQRKRRDGGGIIWSDKGVDWGVATSGEVAWL